MFGEDVFTVSRCKIKRRLSYRIYITILWFITGERKILQRGVVLSLFPFKRRRSHEDEERDSRRLKHHRPEATVTPSSESSDYMVTLLQDQDIEYQPPAATASSSSPHPPPLDIAAECTIMEPTISSHSAINTEEDFIYFSHFSSTNCQLIRSNWRESLFIVQD